MIVQTRRAGAVARASALGHLAAVLFSADFLVVILFALLGLDLTALAMTLDGAARITQALAAAG